MSLGFIMNRRVHLTTLLSIAALGLVGCNSSGPAAPKLVPVKGIVTFKGAPLAGATISFFGPNAPNPGMAVSNEKGEFSLYSSAGENVVSVQMAAEESGGTMMDPSKMMGGGTGAPTTATVQSKSKPKVELPKGVEGMNSRLRVTVGPDGVSDAKVDI